MSVVHPGEVLRDELRKRGWSQIEFAEIVGRPVGGINRIINGKTGITVRTAIEFGAAFGTSAQFWMNLWNAYRLAKLEEQI